jgi:hypothetical protein
MRTTRIPPQSSPRHYDNELGLQLDVEERHFDAMIF